LGFKGLRRATVGLADAFEDRDASGDKKRGMMRAPTGCRINLSERSAAKPHLEFGHSSSPKGFDSAAQGNALGTRPPRHRQP
jgi:hypothetical protein